MYVYNLRQYPPINCNNVCIGFKTVSPYKIVSMYVYNLGQYPPSKKCLSVNN